MEHREDPFIQQALGILLLYKLSNLLQYNLHPNITTAFHMSLIY